LGKNRANLPNTIEVNLWKFSYSPAHSLHTTSFLLKSLFTLNPLEQKGDFLRHTIHLKWAFPLTLLSEYFLNLFNTFVWAIFLDLLIIDYSWRFIYMLMYTEFLMTAKAFYISLIYFPFSISSSFSSRRMGTLGSIFFLPSKALSFLVFSFLLLFIFFFISHFYPPYFLIVGHLLWCSPPSLI